ncbi:hypothetical protein FOA52_004886 [Chlamydomonas sp. UWO 241]|nr:hypothetical protein FOA52_004886 [Chlamydomonas sp. UWO 241]
MAHTHGAHGGIQAPGDALGCLKLAIKKGGAAVDRQADEACCGKWHLREECTPTVDMVTGLVQRHLAPVPMAQPLLRLQIATLLAKAVCFSTEGKIYDDASDKLLNKLDEHARAAMTALPTPLDPPTVAALRGMAGVFDEAAWTSYQDYGLMQDLKLSAWARAREMLGELAPSAPAVAPPAAARAAAAPSAPTASVVPAAPAAAPPAGAHSAGAAPAAKRPKLSANTTGGPGKSSEGDASGINRGSGSSADPIVL